MWQWTYYRTNHTHIIFTRGLYPTIYIMNLLQTNKKSHNDIIKNVAKRIFKYIGLAPKEIKKCPKCWEAGFSTYEYLNVITRQVVYSCYDCIKDLTIETTPQIAVIHLGGKSKEKAKLPTSYPVKDFLLSRSYLVQLNEKEANGREWNTKELAQEDRIFNKRDKAMYEIKRAINKYYDTVINGDYRTDGMPEIRRGVRGWIEEKIWKILIAIGEPNAPCLKDEPAEYWEEAR